MEIYLLSSIKDVLFDIKAIASYVSSEFTGSDVMTSSEKRRILGLGPEYAKGVRLEIPPLLGDVNAHLSYDPELLYVECQNCGKPVLWEEGKTTDLLLAAGVDLSKLDERCMIISEGCPACSPGVEDGYSLAVVRLAGLTPEEAMYMSRPGGKA